MLRCPAGASLWLSEVRQENAFTQRAVYVASQTACPHCELRGQCLGRGAKGNRARRVSAVRRLLPSSRVCRAKSSSSRSHPVGGCRRSSASPYVDNSLAQTICRGASSCGNAQACFSTASSTTCGALALLLELVRSVRTKCVVGATPTAHHGCWCPCLSCYEVTQEKQANTETISVRCYLPSELIMRAKTSCLFSTISSIRLLFACCQLVAHPVDLSYFW